MKSSHGASKEVWVEVDISEWDDDELVEEMEHRGFEVRKAVEKDPWTRLADAFHFQRDPDRVLRDLIYEHTGRIIQ